ncbi:MAG: DNA cytosine methyltransferase, partial [Salinispira sp.]
MKKSLKYIDLFAGAGGLSEGFIRAGFEPIAHVELDSAACFTLRTRMAYHWLKRHDRIDTYADYLNAQLTRSEFYNQIPDRVIKSVIHAEINEKSLSEIFRKVDTMLRDQKLDLIIGGPPCQAYSLVGRSRDRNNMKGDKRNYLYIHYAEFLRRYQPSYFVFENVTGLLSAKDSDDQFYFDKMRALFQKCGYETEYRTLSAEEYGVL